MARHAVYTSVQSKGATMFTHTCTRQLLIKAHLTTEFTLHKSTQEFGWVLSNESLVYEFFLVHLVYIHYIEVAGATRRVD